MASSISSSALLLRPRPPPLLRRAGRLRRSSKPYFTLSPIFASSSSSSTTAPLMKKEREKEKEKEEEVVIVGGGIAGLATALALRRLGVAAAVLEQGASLRSGGTSLTLSTNGWRVLDVLGVADELRAQFLQIQGEAIPEIKPKRLVMRSQDGRELRSFRFEDEAPGQEVRAVERRVLLETLAGKLPPNTISFSSRLRSIAWQGKDGTLLELDDGRQVLAKIVIGCDGVNSPIAKWMGFPEPKYVGHCAFRGLGQYPEGQPYESKVNYIYGRGLRAGFVPVSPTKVYWFICFNSQSPGPRTTDPSALKKEALDLVQTWPQELLDIMRNTPDDTVVKTPLVDRWLWPGLSPPPVAAALNGSSSAVAVVVGDAWHPMTPNLGQGACCALEDAVVLAGKLAPALTGSRGAVVAALGEYAQERWARVFPLTARASLVGSLLQWEDPIVCAFRNEVMIPRLVRLGPFLEHTNFECELLEPIASN
ncbi:uncharacterized protein LOC109715112 isoform X2 [Ananas comosus]|uniref:Uncharacterized protein LOC109715112 isoform X2 n=1 Tax=Ananas comosus TaxID=4615 RepID=A0A6P5FGW3_ANACO|nr:uncharacterized protein LOC109715112 isoform X2 [Ananas comosus]